MVSASASALRVALAPSEVAIPNSAQSSWHSFECSQRLESLSSSSAERRRKRAYLWGSGRGVVVSTYMHEGRAAQEEGVLEKLANALRGPSEGHQRAIRGPSKGHQRAIRGSSEGHQRAIRGPSEGHQRAIRGSSRALTRQTGQCPRATAVGTRRRPAPRAGWSPIAHRRGEAAAPAPQRASAAARA